MGYQYKGRTKILEKDYCKNQREKLIKEGNYEKRVSEFYPDLTCNCCGQHDDLLNIHTEPESFFWICLSCVNCIKEIFEEDIINGK